MSGKATRGCIRDRVALLHRVKVIQLLRIFKKVTERLGGGRIRWRIVSILLPSLGSLTAGPCEIPQMDHTHTGQDFETHHLVCSSLLFPLVNELIAFVKRQHIFRGYTQYQRTRWLFSHPFWGVKMIKRPGEDHRGDKISLLWGVLLRRPRKSHQQRGYCPLNTHEAQFVYTGCRAKQMKKKK